MVTILGLLDHFAISTICIREAFYVQHRGKRRDHQDIIFVVPLNASKLLWNAQEDLAPQRVHGSVWLESRSKKGQWKHDLPSGPECWDGSESTHVGNIP